MPSRGLHFVEVSRQKALEHSMGAVLVGSLVALFLSGAVWMQVFLYIQLYPRDRPRIKFMVFLVWVLDTIHSAMAITANWQYLILHFGDWDIIDSITWSIATTVALTALITFFVHCFFIHRIHTLSRQNLYIAVPLVALALVRLVSALISTSEMIRLNSFAQFVYRYDYVFTIGLSTAASLDILIAGALCYFLRRGRSGFSGMDKIVDAITLYTIENGLLTCITTVVSLICWVSMPTNLIFLGLHFAISKLYANSLLATLNARKSLLNKSQGSSAERDHPLPILFPDSFQRRTDFRSQWSHTRSQGETGTRLEVNIQKTVERDIEIEPNSAFPLVVSPASPPTTGSQTNIDVVKSPQGSFLAE
ncbi:hypothetical protein PYCCODRAFT_1468825 [Trametes coccinea BRFM310]|uniref:DUF6534 domain-containing protein n=1 Tax=Trametes coccinea (strain BRFM310) TaxID=1353009 RepID=A0A1Y2IJ23_TRAC3|nr:hypothetical protein PYCCODRAFT_1468825 [Trametes coccinea BRFM310]